MTGWQGVVVLVAGMVCCTALLVALIFATAGQRQETKR